MKLVQLNKIFKVQNGNGFSLSDMQVGGNIPFIARGSKNNGMVEKVHEENVKPFEGGTISVALSGSVLESFYQEIPYYTSYHIAILTPIKPMQEREMLYYCMAIKANNYKYNYGRQANKTIREIMLPRPEDMPLWVKKIDIPQISGINLIRTSSAKIDTSKWKEFKVGNIFKITKGVNIPKQKRKKGKIPYISGSRFNNGMMDKIEPSNVKELERIKKNALTLNNNGSVGYCFFHDYEFIASDSATVIEFKDQNMIMTPHMGIFLKILFEKIGAKYGYGRKIGDDKLRREIIKLPTKENGEPDWKAAELYTKYIPK